MQHHVRLVKYAEGCLTSYPQGVRLIWHMAKLYGN